MYMKKVCCNIKFSNSKLIWCFFALFMMISFAIKVNCSDGFKKSIITLPKAEDGIEKLEYIVNGEPKGSTDGIDYTELEPGAKINFAVKFQSEGYSKLRVRSVKINSENGSVLRLNTYNKDDEGNFILMRVRDDELLNPGQTYISSDYTVSKDDKLYFEGIIEDEYCIKIFGKNNDLNLLDAIKFKYSKNSESYVDAEFSENENAFLINGITRSSNVKLMFEIQEGYTNSNISLISNGRQIAVDEKSKICTLPELKEDTNLEIINLEKNSYDVTFNEYTNAKFFYKITGSDDEFESSETVKVRYGNSLEFKCETDNDDILSSGEVTVNGKTLVANNGVYSLEDIKDNSSVAITPKENALYTISLPKGEDRITLCDTSGNEVSEITTKQKSSVDFKIVPGDAYQENFIMAEMYAVPTSKLSDGTYDVTVNPEEAKSFLVIPSGGYVYTLENVTEPVKIIASGMKKSVYTVTLPEKIIGATAEVETNENVTKLTDNKFKVVHGSDLVVNLEPELGYDLSTINVSDISNSLEFTKDQNKYTFRNIDDDKYITITGASPAMCRVSFEAADVVATNESGSAWKDNTALVEYQKGTIKFKVRPAEKTASTDEDILLSIKSGSGNLEKLSSEKNTYLLSAVTEDIVLSSNKTQNTSVTITLKSDNDDLQFTDANDENIVLPEENTVSYGTNLNFKIVSKSGRSTDNISVVSGVSNPIVENETASNTYSLTALRSGETSTMDSSSPKQGQYVDLCERFHLNEETTYNKIFNSSLCAKYENGIPPMILVFSKDSEACECINMEKKIKLRADNYGNVITTIDTSDQNFAVNSENEGKYTISLSVPNLVSLPDYRLRDVPLDINFETNVMSDVSVGKTYVTYSCKSEILKVSEYTENKISDRSIPDDSSSIPDPTLTEENTGDYCSAIKDFENIPKGATALRYLKDCYCHSFTQLYTNVTLKDSLTFDALHQSDIDFENLVNMRATSDSDKFGIFIEAQPVESFYPPEHYEIDLNPVTVSFRIYLNSDKKFADGVTAPLCLGEGAYAKITQQNIGLDSESDRYYVDCTLLVTPYGENIELEWSNNSEIITHSHNITFISDNNSSLFYGSSESSSPTITSTSAEHGNGLTFYTGPTEGYEKYDSLIINMNSKDYIVDNISKIRINQGDSNTREYNNDWIKLGGNPEIFIRASETIDSLIEYEIAGNTEFITEYIEAPQTGRSDENSNNIIYNLEKPVDAITPQGIVNDLSITSNRSLRSMEVIFSYVEGIRYRMFGGEEIYEGSQFIDYGRNLAFKVLPEDGYDISNIQVTASANAISQTLNLTNGYYIVTKVSDRITVSVSGVQKTNVSLSFQQHEGITYKDGSGKEYLLMQQVPYTEEIVFQIDISEEYSQSEKDIVINLTYPNSPDTKISFGDSPLDESGNPQPYKQDNLYIIPEEYVNQDIKITIGELNANEYSISLTPSQGIKYIDSSGEGDLPELNEGIAYGNSFKFRIDTVEGYEISDIEVVAKADLSNTSPVTLIPTNGIYTIENITSNYTVSVSGISKQQRTIEFRTVTGVACLDSYGATLPSSVTVENGEDFSFYLSFDSAYSKSESTANVTIKGSNNTVPRDSSGKYTLSNVTENKIIEIINVTKNSYIATFIPAEGVVYRTAKGKEFSGTLNVEYGESLYFKISLLDAYDQSTPNVKMNGTQNLVENSGSYVLENISDDVTVTVENVEKNPEELTIEDIQKVPDSVANENDVDTVVEATKAYDSLSDEDKNLVTNKQELEKAQSEAGSINHSSNGVTISGVDWNIKLIVTPLSDNQEEVKAFEEKVERRSVLSLYRAELIDLLTGENYSIPYGEEVQITIPCPDLTGYKNVTVAHENLAGNMAYFDLNIIDDTAKFSANSLGLFGIAAKEIPNYSEDTSDISISMGNLVSDDEELKTLLGENLSSKLGHLIDLEDENENNESNDSGGSDSNSSDSTDSLMNSMANGAMLLTDSVYNWALDNEFLAVILILVLGSLLILIILIANRKKDKNNENDNLKKRKP